MDLHHTLRMPEGRWRLQLASSMLPGAALPLPLKSSKSLPLQGVYGQAKHTHAATGATTTNCRARNWQSCRTPHRLRSLVQCAESGTDWNTCTGTWYACTMLPANMRPLIASLARWAEATSANCTNACSGGRGTKSSRHTQYKQRQPRRVRRTLRGMQRPRGRLVLQAS